LNLFFVLEIWILGMQILYFILIKNSKSAPPKIIKFKKSKSPFSFKLKSLILYKMLNINILRLKELYNNLLSFI